MPLVVVELLPRKGYQLVLVLLQSPQKGRRLPRVRVRMRVHCPAQRRGQSQALLPGAVPQERPLQQTGAVLASHPMQARAKRTGLVPVLMPVQVPVHGRLIRSLQTGPIQPPPQPLVRERQQVRVLQAAQTDLLRLQGQKWRPAPGPRTDLLRLQGQGWRPAPGPRTDLLRLQGQQMQRQGQGAELQTDQLKIRGEMVHPG